jgi:hypothetical protein
MNWPDVVDDAEGSLCFVGIAWAIAWAYVRTHGFHEEDDNER